MYDRENCFAPSVMSKMRKNFQIIFSDSKIETFSADWKVGTTTLPTIETVPVIYLFLTS